MTVETASEEAAADNAALDLPWASAERVDECPDDTVHSRLLRFSPVLGGARNLALTTRRGGS